ncbi:MAG: pyruvate dehydrogenase complex E1 component subunit beta [Anaerolineales bacterium]
MSVFRSTEELYAVMGALFERLKQDAQLAERLLEGNLVVRFRWRNPEGEATIDLRRAPITYTFGPCDLQPDVEMIQDADVAHLFWLGKLNVPRAIASRQVIAKGSVPKALKLLPAIQPAFAVYRQVLIESGRKDLVSTAAPRPGSRKRAAWLRRLKQRWAGEKAEVKFEPLKRHFIPLLDSEPSITPPVASPAPLPSEEKELKREMLRRMMLIRAFEEHLSRAFAEGKLPTEAIHLSIGQEATAVGACFALSAQDTMATTHRGHGHMLAKGADLRGMMAEIYGKATGLCKGKGGSMHVTDARVGALGANGIVGASALIATGAALATKLQGERQVSLAFLGDGAMNQGMFHEAACFASVFQLPVIFLVENNQYAEFTPLAKHTRVPRLADRAAAYGIPGVQVDGNDVWAVYEAVRQAVEDARAGKGPRLIECVTYRWHGHMEGETASYRTQEEIERWQKQDPIARWKERLLAEGVLIADEAQKMAQEVDEQIADAVRFAEDSPLPGMETLTEDVFAPEPAVLYQPHPLPPASREVTFSQALWEALAEEMSRDGRVFLLGEDVSQGGYFAVTTGLAEEFTGRVLDTPISEYAIVGAAVGAAMCGMRPVAEILFSDFLTTCMDPLVNQAAKLRYMSGGQYALPLVVRTPGGAGLGMAAQHSQSLEALLTGIPGLIVIAPSTPLDAKGLLKAAIRSNNPVLFFENKLLYLQTGKIPEGEYLIPIGVADVKRAGHDVTVVAIGSMVSLALSVAEGLAQEGIEVEVIDPRTLVPLDVNAILRSVQKTGRLVTVEEGALHHGFGAEIAARVAEVAPQWLKAPVQRVAAVDIPIPYARNLERAAVPDEERLKRAIYRALGEK